MVHFITGHTDDLEKRMSEHQTLHYHCYTRSILSVAQIFGSRDEAIAAERQTKGWSRAKKQALADDDLYVCKKIGVHPSMRYEAYLTLDERIDCCSHL